MAKKNLVLMIEAEQAYLKATENAENSAAKNEILFNAISETYIPLLNMFTEFEKEGIPFSLAMVLSAPLCTLLSDSEIQNQFIEHTKKRIALGEDEVKRNSKNPKVQNLALFYLEKAKNELSDFSEKYKKDLVSAFRHFQDKGFLELIPTAATYAYLPHYSELKEVLNAQIETGLYAQRQFFGDVGDGFALPFMGYSKNLDKTLREYGINYTVVDARSILFSKDDHSEGIFSPLRTKNSLVLFASDPDCKEEIYGDKGFSKKSPYRAQFRDIGFDLEAKDLSSFISEGQSRVQTGYKYFANGEWDEDDDEKIIYSPEEAEKQAQEDADDFYNSKKLKLDKAASLLNGKDPVLVCVIPAEILGQAWYEGVSWLEKLLRTLAYDRDINLTTCRELTSDQFKLPKIEPYPCSSNGSGYGEDLLDSSNSWTFRYLKKASERMIDLTDHFTGETGLKQRLLNLGAKELLLAQSGTYLQMIHDGRLPDIIEEQFKKNILSFTTVFESLGSNSISTEWLTRLEKEDSIFPWLSYRIFSRKK